MINREELEYRKNVAGVIINNSGLILTCKRFDEFSDWQLPQGGIDEGESEDEAILRELHEEILLTDGEIIDKTPHYFKYDWPDNLLARGYRGQEQKLFLIKSPLNFKPDLDNALSKEFKEFKWVSLNQFYDLIQETFRFPAYSKGLEYFNNKHPQIFKNERN